MSLHISTVEDIALASAPAPVAPGEWPPLVKSAVFVAVLALPWGIVAAVLNLV